MAHTNSVTYLPIFLAYVTTGKITINSLRINEGYRSGPQILDKRLIDLDNVLPNAGETQNAKKKTKPFPIL